MLNLMDKSKGGQGGIILNISSVAGLVFFKDYEIYCATKHAVLAYTKSLSHGKLFEQTGVTLMTLCPGVTETPIIKYIKEIENHRVQPVDVVGEYLVQCVETGKNGGIYMIHDSIGTEIEQNPYKLHSLL